MASKLIVSLVCDLHDSDPVPAAQPVRFGIDGHLYQVDVCPGCAARLRGVLAPFISRARPAGVLRDLLPGKLWLAAAGATGTRGPSEGGRRDPRTL